MSMSNCLARTWWPSRASSRATSIRPRCDGIFISSNARMARSYRPRFAQTPPTAREYVRSLSRLTIALRHAPEPQRHCTAPLRPSVEPPREGQATLISKLPNGQDRAKFRNVSCIVETAHPNSNAASSYLPAPKVRAASDAWYCANRLEADEVWQQQSPEPSVLNAPPPCG